MGIQAVPMEGMEGYFGLEVDGKPVGGLQDMGSNFPAEVPPHWMTWFAVDDVDSTVDAAVKRGATVVVPPTDMPIGRIAGIQDPWGAVFCVIRTAPPAS
jgi:predicted enzyme related to lactoylglutathione lyase